MSDKTTITMKDIARELGVSVATVSRALKNNPSISQEQRERIQAFARDHHFLPNALAESLRLSRVAKPKIIGVIVPQFAHYYFSTILAGIEEEATLRGYNILVAQSAEQYEREVAICESYLLHRVCGVIVSQAKDTLKYDHFRHLLEAGLPLVFYDRICTGLNTSRVVVDDYTGAQTAVAHLIQTGCRRIAFYGSDMHLEISKNRYNGYRDALLQAGLNVDDSLVLDCDNRSGAEALTPALLMREDRPDGVFAVNDDTAIGVLYTAKRMGLHVPDDLGICGFTNGERAVACDPMLTTIEQRGHRVGAEAVKILLDHVEGRIPIDKVEKRVVRTRLIVRGTTRPLPSST
ncbi:MAG: LacI family transcriptional regulator [Bacteroidales bacterium]|nr:LacI family transcriptional regulator [Bacteroidales bacterium]